MSLFVCDECKCIENTALGHYWGSEVTRFKDSSKNGKVLCSECAPAEFEDGSINPNWGKWHNKFEKRTVNESAKILKEKERLK